MIDSSKHQVFKGSEVVSYLLAGERIYDEDGVEYYYNGLLWMCEHGISKTTKTTFNELVSRRWYKKKPFDVRQAMRNKPDEWVGAFKNPDGYWLKVGFSTKRYVVLMASIHYSLTVGFAARETENYTPTSDELDRCIPIKDVPKDAY